MPLNRAYLGRRLRPAFEHHVTADELLAFADALGETNPAYRSAAAAAAYGHPAVIAPPTFAAVLAFRAQRPLLDDPAFGADPRSLRHRDERITSYRPVYAGDRVRGTVRITSIEEIPTHGILTTETTLHTDETLIAHLRTTLAMAHA